jgi:hypothetical protein
LRIQLLKLKASWLASWDLIIQTDSP